MFPPKRLVRVMQLESIMQTPVVACSNDALEKPNRFPPGRHGNGTEIFFLGLLGLDCQESRHENRTDHKGIEQNAERQREAELDHAVHFC